MSMKKKTKLAAVVAPVLAVSVALTACGGNDQKANTEPKKEGKGEEKLAAKQVLNLLESQEIPSMDSAKATDAVSFNVMNNVMEGLYRLDKDQKPTPGVAESFKKSDDGKTYTFKLRKDAKWSNGDPVTAKDFVFAWQRAVNPETAAEYAYIMFDVKNAEKINKKELPVDQLGVKAIDDQTLEVQLENAVPYFVELTSFATFYPQNEKFIKEQGAKYALEANTGVYNGPFVLSEWKHEQSFKLTKNDKYWDNKTVKLTEINFNIVKDVGTGVNLYEAGDVDRAGLSAEFVDKYKSSPELVTSKDASVFFLRFNQKRGGQDTPLANLKVRQALSMSFDKAGITNVILNNGSVPADYLVPQDFVKGADGKDFRATNGAMNKFNADKAKKLWEEAKKELGKDKLTIELLNYDTESAKKIGEYLKAQMEKNLPGLTVNIKQQPFKQKLDIETKEDYEMSYAGWGPDYPDPMTFIDMFVTKGAHNQMNYSNSKYDQLVKDGKTTLTTDPKKRLEALAQAEKILFEDAAIAPLFQRGTSSLMRSNVKGWVDHNFGGDYSYKWVYLTEKEDKK
ncbi:peptide ABC transporter substrate-binding protein [Ectobacillus sp. JY-23]|uniref:peptide ABC transporter substrate-binding protein n=1 Tax=Ectobacillus sp. JY-23 TaxID=2933872 RepID=UPI001FF49ABB|nr:peptide ABC transporter substrate-binding protein [Ectobacillus sp. JY-23]UOY93209.1 peptide ABC transporter substrate-binding protein [Ectobacillus sp. JY-23]